MTRILRSHAKIVPGEVYDASIDAERIRADARRQGFEQGRQEGLAAASEALMRARREAAEEMVRSEPDLRRLAVRIAEKILSAELAVRPEVVEEIVQQALALAGTRRRLVLRVHPEDAPLLQTIAAENSLSVEPDAEIGRGGCVLVAGRVSIDARIETQMLALRRALGGEDEDR